MAKKRSKEEQMRLEKKNLNFFYGSFVFLILLFLFFYFIDFNAEPGDDDVIDYSVYNEYDFRKVEGFENVWETYVQLGGREERIQVRYHPLELEHIHYDANATQLLLLAQMLKSDVVFSLSKGSLTTGSGKVSLAAYDLVRVLSYYSGFSITVAAEDDDEYEWIDCDASSPELVVIGFKIGDMRIETESFCVKLYFDTPDEAVMVSSLLIYKALGIMT